MSLFSFTTKSSKLYFYLWSNPNTYIKTDENIISANQTMWLKGSIKNNIAEFFTSINGVNWKSWGQIDTTNLPTNYDTTIPKIGIQGNATEGWAFTGSIDLENTYIKVGNNYLMRGYLTDSDKLIVTNKNWDLKLT